MNYITENTTILNISHTNKISKKMPVFYNPVMKLNRDISIEILKNISNNEISIALPLSGSGVRGIRILKELPVEKIREIHFNDYSKTAVSKIKENLKVNKINFKNNSKDNAKKIFIHNDDATLFLLQSKGFDYIDIDPFGTPNPFLDASIKRISREGVLAVTATDTSALAGTYKDAGNRKYWAKTVRNYQQHEIGLRTLIRKVQLIGAQYDKALIPIFSYSKDHYYRVFFKCTKGKKNVDEMLTEHKFLLFDADDLSFIVSNCNCKVQDGKIKDIEYAGPLWTGSLWNIELVKKMKLYELETIKDESLINVVGFYDIHELVSKYKLKSPRFDELISKIRKKGFKAARTHVSPYGIKSTIGLRELLTLMK